MKIKNIIFLALVIAFSNSCKKKKETIEPKPVIVAEIKEDIIEISTTYGTMYVWLYKATPLHRTNYLKLANEGYYDNSTFHRNIANFVIQGGDPNSKDDDSINDGTGGPGYTVPEEIRDTIKHDRGALAAARMPDNVNPNKESSGSQFYICVSKSGTTFLNKNYTVFGMVMKGLEVIDLIVKQPQNSVNNRPFSNIKMQVKVLKKTLTEIKTEYGYTPRQ
ncbi:MAG: peptidylprolyl isomerase [Bacteroidetes bacterium]|nr:peptidylprolyl isomerase [Bacteroidota bacterium]